MAVVYSDDAANGAINLTNEQRRTMTATDIEEYESQGLLHAPPVDETSPLLLSSGASTSSSTSSHSGRQRSLWQRIRAPNPFWMAALTFFGSISRSMVLAPRVEAYTQIACHNLPLHHTDSPHTHLNTTPINTQLDLRGIYVLAAQEPFVWVPLPVVAAANETRDNDDNNGDDDEPITTIPSKDCLRNPKVQAEASRIQYLMTLIMGVLSSFSTGLWGQFGDRYGRRPVLIASSFGLMFVDIVFLLVAIPHSAFSGHGHRVLLVAPFVEGLLGGWSTFIAATNAYISDCTENGSRAKIFSRISGLTYVGFALGPILGNLWVRLHPAHTTDRVFLLSIAMAAINLTLLALLVPESVSEEDRQKRQERSREATPPNTGLLKQTGQSVFAFLAPLKLFVPKTRGGEVSWSDYKDWNLTCLAIAMFCYLLTVALFQIKYLYATTVYLWDGTQLNNYISVMGLVRGLHLLFILPALIRIFRNRSSRNVTLQQRSVLEAHSQDVSDAEAAASSREIHFDLLVVKFSLGLDLTSHLLVTLLHPSSGIAFTAMTALSSMGAGLLPAAQSLALCIMHASGESAEVGKLFGALSVLQAVGSTILGPTVFAMLYQRTVGKWNEAIFALAAGMILVALAMVSMIRSRKYVIEGTLASVRAHRKHWLREEGFAESTTVSSPAAGPSTNNAAVGSLLGVPVPGGRRRGKERGRSRRSKDISLGSSSVSDSDPSRSLPQAFHKYKLPLQQQDSAAA